MRRGFPAPCFFLSKSYSGDEAFLLLIGNDSLYHWSSDLTRDGWCMIDNKNSHNSVWVLQMDARKLQGFTTALLIDVQGTQTDRMLTQRATQPFRNWRGRLELICRKSQQRTDQVGSSLHRKSILFLFWLIDVLVLWLKEREEYITHRELLESRRLQVEEF